jgi:DNA-directed RNA polymerase subunit L
MLGTFHDFTETAHGGLDFSLKDSEVFVANAIRRNAISSIPTLAFFDENLHDNSDSANIQIEKNTGALHNEVLKHRLLLLPIFQSPDDVPDFHKYRFNICRGGGGSGIGEGGRTSDVTTADIKGTYHAGVGERRDLSREELDAFFVSPATGCGYILITRLRPTEELRVRLRLTKGTAKEHATFSPVSKCVFINEVDPQKVAKAVSAAEAAGKPLCPKLLECHDKYRLFSTNAVGEANRFRFSIEPIGQRKAHDVVLSAIDLLRQDTHALLQRLSTTNEVEVSCCSKNIEDNVAVDIRCPGLDHGLANLVNGFIYNREFTQQKDQQGQLSYFGFHKPHPLEDAIVFRLVLAKTAEETHKTKKEKTASALHLFQDHLEVLEEKLEELKGNLRGTTFPLRPPPGA